MKRWLVTVMAAALASAAFAADMVTQARLIAPMTIPGSKDGQAMIQGLKADALQMGLGETVLKGVATYEPQGDGTTRVSVQWAAIGVTSGMATKSLRSPLSSQFRTADKSIQPGTIINVRGDLDLLAEDFLALKASMAKDSPKDTVKQVNNNNTTTEAGRGAADLAQTGGASGTGGSGNSPYTLPTDNNKIKTDMVTTSWQDCQPRIDRTGAMTYQQARKVDMTESGKVMSTGTCEDHGVTAPIVRTYDGACLPVIDIDNRKVYHQFIETSDLNSKTLSISTCTADFQKFDTVKATNTGCGYRHDFGAGKSVLQEKLYYNDLQGKVVDVRDCADSASAYAQYATTATCTPTIDAVNKQVFINNRVAFKDGNNAEQYATDCKPDGNPSFAISEEFCTPKYEHDFVNHVSYYRTRAYYTTAAGAVVYVSECARSALSSFPHIFATSSCSVTNDDVALMTHFSKVTQINSPTDGIVEIAPCQEMGSPTPYAYVSRLNGTTSVLKSNTFLGTYLSLSERLPGVEWVSGTNTYAFGAMTCTISTAYGNNRMAVTTNAPTQYGTYPTAPTPSAESQRFQLEWGMNFDANGYYLDATVAYMANYGISYGGSFQDRITMRPYNKRYLRGDGSYYDLPDGAHYRAEIYCNGAWLP